jgi:hypothetical protein
MTPTQVRIEGHTEIVKMLGSEATNQNVKLYMRSTLGSEESKVDPPTELLKNCKKKFRNHVLLQNFFVGTGLK